MHLFGFVWLSIRRLISRSGLTLLSLLGIMLAVGMVSSIPVFTRAVSFIVLREELLTLGKLTQRPPVAIRTYFLASERTPLSLESIRTMERLAGGILSSELGLPIRMTNTQAESPAFALHPAPENPRFAGGSGQELKRVALVSAPAIAGHIVVDEGEALGAGARDDGRIAVWAHQSTADQMGLQVGECYNLVHPATQYLIRIYIAGFWQARDRQDPYWFEDPAVTMRDAFLITPGVYEEAIEPLLPEHTGLASWYMVLNENSLTVQRADVAATGLERAINRLSVVLPGCRVDYSPLGPLQRYQQRQATLSVLLVGFSLPAIGLLGYFLSLISSVTVFFQREETALLASRGGGRLFILGLALTETALLLLLGTPLGLLMGYLLAHLMGYTQSFLSFVSRPALPVALGSADWRLLGATLLVLLMARLIPAWRASGESIVTHLRGRSRPVALSIAARAALDIPLIITSAYAYQRLQQRGTLGILGWDPSGDPFRDPLLLLAPSLFVFTGCLVVAHLFPLLMRPFDRLSAHLPSLPGYLGLRQLVRQSGQYTNALFLVCVCLSLGAFYSSLALSLDQWLRDRLYYRVGADLVLQQGIDLRQLEGAGSSATVAALEQEGGWLLPASDYLEIPGVRAATRVGDFPAIVQLPQVVKGRFLGVDRLDFPQVAYFRRDFSRMPLGGLLNRLGMYPDGVLVSRRFLTANSLLEGQRLNLELNVGPATQKVDLTIVGTFDYFPTMYPEKGEVFVGDLEHLFEQVGGIYRHQIWLCTEPNARPADILKQVEGMGVVVAGSDDTRQLIAADEGRVERVGLFGVLSIGFLAGSILSCVGLLLYTYASLQGRLQQLSVLRAIGVRLGDILATVGVEYAGVIAYGIAAGVAIGAASSHLFVPFFQYSSDPALLAPPFLPQIAWAKIAWIAGVFAVALILSQLAILYRVTQKDVFQVLRMGQRE